MKRLKVTPFFQKKDWSCGPVSVKMLLKFFGVRKTEKELIKLCKSSERWGTHPLRLVQVLENLGFKTIYNEWGSHRKLDYLINHRMLPVIVDWFREDDGHYSVACRLDKKHIWIADPAIGKIEKMSWKKFQRVWFDFEGDYLKRKKSLWARWWLAAYPK